ncbi:glycosyl hydrolase [Actinomyces ruminis]|uniref:Glycosyl hydrolase n=2 Tax=Actinomyces ruminis TaxID=1937003 RepID=A0ABX4MD06_9ACTO|nr:glycosyl hydrolase [Actinomyces ruminis]
MAELLSGKDFWSTHASADIRSLVLTDGPHGVRRQAEGADHLGIMDSLPATCFPTGAATACSFDTGLLEEIGRALGEECRTLGVDVLLGPGINIKRSPLGGRNFEYFSEDPLLAGALGAAWVRGVQGTGVGTSLKHFAVNNQETARMSISAEVDERTLRELYLAAFEIVVTQAQPTTVMSSYNAINGVFSSENHRLLTGILREEWGFDGLVVSDWGAVKDRVEALRAGLDLDMPGNDGASTQAIVDAVHEGRLDREAVEIGVERLRRLAQRITATPKADFDIEAHHALARRAAAESMVLLHNDGVLPLEAGTHVAVIGEFAIHPQFQGSGSSRVNPTRVDTPLEALRTALGADNVSFAPGYGTSANTDLLSEAVATARAAEVAVVFVGLDTSEQSEGFDRTDLRLPADQIALIRAVAEVRPVVVVLSNGGVVTMEEWHDQASAILETWTAGQGAGMAVADILTGAVNPSGRLAETIPLALEDTPSFLNFPGEHDVTRYGEGVFVGYRYYSTLGRPVRYPFGYGLSYTTFDRSLQVTVTGPDTALARVTVTNTGERTGSDVVQVYVAPAPSAVRRPVRELAGFTKVHLGPGESTTVELPLERRRFAHWDVNSNGWLVDPGRYAVELGISADQIIAAKEIELEGDTAPIPALTLESSVKDWFEHPVVGPLLQEAMTAGATPEQLAAAEENAHLLQMVETMPMAQFAQFPGVNLSGDTLNRLAARSTE